ncbi:AarF/ABC1/UbiB kinase family protein [bacterium]|nr:AarF/ABC1/UbiB kinase family protein [bacterium]
MKKLKTSVLSRSAHLIGAASRIAGHELTQKIKNQISQSIENNAPEILKTRIQQAKILTENLSQLKGAAMKVGQLLSIDSSDLIPPEVLEILSQLQAKSEAIDYSQIEAVLKKEIPEPLLSELKIDSNAFSAASIGQVHKAVYKNQDLALKVQYPGVADTIDSDLLILSKTVGAFLTLTQKPMVVNDVFSELAKILRQETDYLREQDLMQKYKTLLQDSSLNSLCSVPHSFPEITTSRVLAMSFEQGTPLKQWLEAAPEMTVRRRIGAAMLDLYCNEFFQWGLVQTDPNFGNYLVRDNETLILLDFGATQEFEQSFIENYRNVLKSFATMDETKIVQASIDFQLLDARESKDTQKNYSDFMKLSVEPFAPHKQPFSFHDQDYTKRSIELGRKFTSSLRYSPPPKHILFLHRKLGGIFNLLRKMEVSLDLTDYWEKMVQTKAPQKVSL